MADFDLEVKYSLYTINSKDTETPSVKPWCCRTTLCEQGSLQALEKRLKAGRNMSIISIVDKSRSLSIVINRQISEVDKNRSPDFLWLSILIDFQCYSSILIDFNRQVSKTKRCMVGDKTTVVERGKFITKQDWLCQDLILPILHCKFWKLK